MTTLQTLQKFEMVSNTNSLIENNSSKWFLAMTVGSQFNNKSENDWCIRSFYFKSCKFVLFT